MAILSESDHDLLDKFLNRVLTQYAKEGLSLIDARSAVAHVIAAVDQGNPEAVQFMQAYMDSDGHA